MTLQKPWGQWTSSNPPRARHEIAEIPTKLVQKEQMDTNKHETGSQQPQKIEHEHSEDCMTGSSPICCATFLTSGAWCSGITSASHAEGPGFNPQCVHDFRRKQAENQRHDTPKTLGSVDQRQPTARPTRNCRNPIRACSEGANGRKQTGDRATTKRLKP